MTTEGTLLLRRKWEYHNKFRTLGNVMGKMEGMGILDFRKEGVLMLSEGNTEFAYTLKDKSIEISLPLKS